MPPRHYDWIHYHARTRPLAPALTDLGRNVTLTYVALDERVARLASFLKSRGINSGDRVAVLAQNCSDQFEILFACGRIGAIFLPLNWRLSLPELADITNRSVPAIFFHDAEHAEACSALSREAGVPMLQIGGGESSPYEEAIRSCSALAEDVPVTHDDVQVLMYTSGTMGRPKGVMLTFGMTFWNAVNVGMPARISPETRFLSAMPLFHTAGLNLFANPVFRAGGQVLVMRGFDAGAVLNAIDDPAFGITHFFAVPAAYQAMTTHARFAATDLSRLQLACVGGAATPQPLLETWLARGVPLANGYGMTETGPAVTLLSGQDAKRKSGSTGQALLNVEVRIVRDDDAEAGVAEAGELWVRGPSVTPGYWRDPAATTAAFEDGWLKTGDIVRRDAEGFFYVLDRAKDMYISGGENVYPAEVEAVLYQIDGVADAAVVGVGDDRWGEAGLAILVVKPGSTLDRDAVIAHCRQNLATFKHPRDVVFTDVLPRTASGKVHKPTLREKFAVGSPGGATSRADAPRARA